MSEGVLLEGWVQGADGTQVEGKFLSVPSGVENLLGLSNTDVIMWVEDDQGRDLSAHGLGGPANAITGFCLRPVS